MKIYIAGKITGLDNYGEKFNKKQKELENMGHIVVNPIVLDVLLGEGFSQEDFMEVCYTLIDLCDCIYLLDNWTDSKGATLERTYAMNKGKEIIYQGGTK